MARRQKQNKNKKTNNEGLGPSEVLNKKNKKDQNIKIQKKNKKEIKNKKKQKILKIELFSYQSKFYSFWVGVQNFPFLTTWP